MRRSSAQAVSVDERGFVIVDGVKIGRRVVKDGAVKLQLCDKDHRRSAERGTRLVEVTVQELGEALEIPVLGEEPVLPANAKVDYWGVRPKEEADGTP